MKNLNLSPNPIALAHAGESPEFKQDASGVLPVVTCSLDLHSLMELTQSPNASYWQSIGVDWLSARVPRVYPLLSDWLRDMECPISRRYSGEKTGLWNGCSALLLLWQESGRCELSWPEKDIWSLEGFLSCVLANAKRVHPPTQNPELEQQPSSGLHDATCCASSFGFKETRHRIRRWSQIPLFFGVLSGVSLMGNLRIFLRYDLHLLIILLQKKSIQFRYLLLKPRYRYRMFRTNLRYHVACPLQSVRSSDRCGRNLCERMR